MLNEKNPLAHDRLDETPEDLQYYGYDSQAPSPYENSDNNVVVSPIYGTPDSEFTRVLQEVDPLRWYTTKENFFSDYSSIKMNFCHDVGGVRGTLKMICVS